MQLVASIADRAVGNELRLQASRLVDGDAVEIGNTVEHTGVADEIIEASSLRILFRRAMVRTAQRGNDRGADEAQVGPPRADEADDVLHAVSDLFQRRIVIPIKIVDPFKPDHVRDACQLEHVALDAHPGGRATRDRFFRAVLGWSRDLVSAYTCIDDSNPVAMNGAQAP